MKLCESLMMKILQYRMRLIEFVRRISACFALMHCFNDGILLDYVKPM